VRPSTLRTRASPGTRLASLAAELRTRGLTPKLLLGAVLVLATALRLWHLNTVGFNSDEAVYSGQGAATANEPELGDLFPVFRAHPLLVQTFLSLGWRLGLDTGFERLVSVAAGVATVYLVYELGRQLYGRRTGLIAALLLALMPYHVVVSRQVLLDGPMTMLATLTLLLLVRFVLTGRPAWLYATGAAMGLTFLAKETSIVLLLAIYAFLALTPELRVRLRDLAIATGVMVLVMAPFPLSIFVTGHSGTGESYLTWQLFRRPNHDWLFYAWNVPEVIGPLVLAAALAGLVVLRRPGSWPERLLLCWIAVPVLFFELWPVKGFQYLLPIVAPVAVLAARPLVGRRMRPVLAVICVSLLVVTVGRVAATDQRTMLAGAGGVPAGREAGEWIDSNVPRGATFMTVGPSMANLVQFYGRREAYGLSVSPNPLNRNPSYEPIPNPDEALRTGDIQYVVWDTFSASRSRGFSDRLLAYAERYDARAVHVETLPVRTPGGHTARRPAIVVYEVRP
jgi:Dolichyl-phosphate-mannose-protein mannosyltransferase